MNNLAWCTKDFVSFISRLMWHCDMIWKFNANYVWVEYFLKLILSLSLKRTHIIFSLATRLHWKRKLRGCGLRKKVFAASKENFRKGFPTILLIDFSKMTHLKVSRAADDIKKQNKLNKYTYFTCRSYHVTTSWHILRSDIWHDSADVRGWIFCPGHPSQQSVLFLTLFNLLLFTVK